MTCPKPDIVLHIGLAAGRTFYTLERGAHRTGYGVIPDVDGKRFPDDLAKQQWPNLPPILKTGFKAEDVWRRWRSNLLNPDVDVRPSEDAGNFMCGFIYYTSMAQFYKEKDDERPVMFLHVPDLPTKEDMEQGREVTCALIRALVDSRRKHGASGGSEAQKTNGRKDDENKEEETAPKTDVNFVGLA